MKTDNIDFSNDKDTMSTQHLIFPEDGVFNILAS